MIQNRNTKGRAEIQTYFNKKAGQMPTKTEWINFIAAFINIADDLELETSDIQGLDDILKKKLDTDQLPDTQAQFDALKSLIETLIDKKTKHIAEAAAKNYTQQLSDLTADTLPVGTIVQYIGDDDDFNRYYPGYFYKKIKDHNPDADTAATQTQDGAAIPIDVKIILDIAGTRYISTTKQNQAADKSTRAWTAGDYIYFAVPKSKVYDTTKIPEHAYLIGDEDPDEYFPIAINAKTGLLATLEYPDKTDYWPYINGARIDHPSTTNSYAEMVFRESDLKPFMLYDCERTINGVTKTIGLLIPAYADGLYDLYADEEEYIYSDSIQTDEFDLNANTTITPRLPIRGTSDYNTDPAWKMIQVSPFVLDE